MSDCAIDAAYTPNPGRAVHIRGEINRAMEEQLRPQIRKLQAASGEPITVYIDSCGGNSSAGERIIEVLRAPAANGEPCRIITIARADAWSTAANILAAGDYAVAQPQSKLLYHGARVPALSEMGASLASVAASVLKSADYRCAESLLECSAERFLFTLFASRCACAGSTAGEEGAALELGHFRRFLWERVSAQGQSLLSRAAAIWERSAALIGLFDGPAATTRAGGESESEKAMIEASMAFDQWEQKAGAQYRFGPEELARIGEHMFFLRAYALGTNGLLFAALGKRWASLTGEGDASDEARSRFGGFIRPFWAFRVAVCKALQESESPLTALDAFWLGLVDTVREVV